MDKKPFLIITLPRSGSYHLRALLDSAPDVSAFGEIFKGSEVELPRSQLTLLGLKPTDTAARDQMGMQALTKLCAQADQKGKIFGFKDFRFNLNRVGILDQIIASTGWRKVFLFRNPVERYVSLKRADLTGVFVVTKDMKTEGLDLKRPIRFDPEEFEKAVGPHRRLKNDVRKAREKSGKDQVFVMDYDAVNDTARLQKLLEFLGSTAQADTLQSTHVKQFAEPLAAGVENWDELVAYLDKTDQRDLIEGR
jgi:LPS sulfotransferase NodH